MNVTKKENANNENNGLQADTLTDLPVVEGADETKGGSDRDVDVSDLNHFRQAFGASI